MPSSLKTYYIPFPQRIQHPLSLKATLLYYLNKSFTLFVNIAYFVKKSKYI